MPRARSAVSSRRFPVFLTFALAAATCAIIYAATPERASTWREHEIRVDGSDEEWHGEELPVKGEHFSLGLANDGQWLYLCLATKDLGLKAQIAKMGLVVWLDPVDGKKRRFGIHFPVPNPPGAARMPRGRVPNEGEGPGTARPEGEADEVPGQGEIGVLGPGKNDAELIPIDQARGIEARVGVHGDLVVYEAKVPLMRGSEHPHAPNVEPGQMARLEIETAPLRGGPMAPTVFGRPWGAGWGITVGPRAGRAVVMKPIDVTTNVKLAKGPR